MFGENDTVLTVPTPPTTFGQDDPVLPFDPQAKRLTDLGNWQADLANAATGLIQRSLGWAAAPTTPPVAPITQPLAAIVPHEPLPIPGKVDLTGIYRQPNEPQLQAAPSVSIPTQFTQTVRDMLSPVLGRSERQVLFDAQQLMASDPAAGAQEAARLQARADANQPLTGSGVTGDLMRGTRQLGDIALGAGLWAHDAVGATKHPTIDRLRTNLKAAIEANPPDVASADKITGGPAERLRKTLDYARGAIAQNLPLMIPSMGAGGLGGSIAKNMVQKQVASALEKEFGEHLGRQLLKSAATKETIGQITGAMAAGTLIEGGSITGEIHDTPGTKPGPKTAAVTALAALPAAFLDSLSTTLGLKKVGGQVATTTVKKILDSQFGRAFMERGVARLGVAGFEQALAEGSTEYLQTALEQSARLYADPDAQGRFLEALGERKNEEERQESGIQGALAGGGLGMALQGVNELNTKLDERLEEQAFTKASTRAAQEKSLAASLPQTGVGLPFPSQFSGKTDSSLEIPSPAAPSIPSAPPTKKVTEAVNLLGEDGKKLKVDLVEPPKPPAAAAKVETTPAATGVKGELRAAQLDPGVFPNKASKLAALKRAAALGTSPQAAAPKVPKAVTEVVRRIEKRTSALQALIKCLEGSDA